MDTLVRKLRVKSEKIFLILILISLLVPIVPIYGNPLEPFFKAFTYESHEGNLGCPLQPFCSCNKTFAIYPYMKMFSLKFKVKSGLKAVSCCHNATSMDVPVTATAFIGAIDADYIKNMYNNYEFLFRPGWEDHVATGDPFRAFAIGSSLLRAAPTFATLNVSQCVGNTCGPFKLTSHVEGEYANISVWFNDYGNWRKLDSKRFHLPVFNCCGQHRKYVLSGGFYPLVVDGIAYDFDFFYFNVSSGRFLTHEEALNYFHNPTTTRILLTMPICPLYRYGSIAYERKRPWDTDNGQMFRYFYSNITTWGWKFWHHNLFWLIFSNGLVYKDSFTYPSLDEAPVREIAKDKETKHITLRHNEVEASVSEDAYKVLFKNRDLPIFVASLNTTEGYERDVVYGPVLRPTIVDYSIETVGPKRYHVKLLVDPNVFWEQDFTKAKLLVISSINKVKDVREILWHSYAGSVFNIRVSGEYDLQGHIIGGCPIFHHHYLFEGTVDLSGRDFSGIMLLAYNNLLYSDPIIMITKPNHKVRPVIEVMDNKSGKAIPGATVIVGNSSMKINGTTDGSGMWAVNLSLDPGLYWVYVYREGYLPRNETFLMDHSGLYRVNLTQATGILTVKVLENGTGSPITDAYVSLIRISDNMTAFAYTDENGSAIFSSDVGTWVVYASKEGYLAGNKTVTITPGNLTSNTTVYLNKVKGQPPSGGSSELSVRVIPTGWMQVELPGNYSGTYFIISQWARYWNGSSYMTGVPLVYNPIENKTYVDMRGGKGIRFVSLEDLMDRPGDIASLLGRNVTVELVRTDGLTLKVRARVGTLSFDHVSVSNGTISGRIVWDDGYPFHPKYDWEFVQIVALETGDSTIISPDGTFNLKLSQSVKSITLGIFFRGKAEESYQVPFSSKFQWKG